MSKGVLTIVSGFSGAGKGTVMKGLLANYDNYALSISATTRRPREGEQDGREYFFKTREEFEQMIAEGAFIEYAQYVELLWNAKGLCGRTACQRQRRAAGN